MECNQDFLEKFEEGFLKIKNIAKTPEEAKGIEILKCCLKGLKQSAKKKQRGAEYIFDA